MMKEVWAIAFRTLEKYYHQQNIPAIAYVLLVKLLRLSSNKKTMEPRELVTPIIRTAVESQISLGTDFTLLGYLSEEWYNALMICNSDKAEQNVHHLHLGICLILFTSIWEQRNTFVHGKDSMTMKYEREQLETELQEWKRVAGTRVGHQ